MVYTYVYFFIAELLLLTQVPQDNPIMEMKKANDNCAICQYAMETLYTILENKDNQDEIRNTLDTLCEYMPSSISKPCEEYVDAYAETVIQLILQDFTPQQICAEIGLCSSVSEVVMTVQDTKCILCEYVIKTLDDLLANNATEAEIKTALEVSTTMIFLSLYSIFAFFLFFKKWSTTKYFSSNPNFFGNFPKSIFA